MTTPKPNRPTSLKADRVRIPTVPLCLLATLVLFLASSPALPDTPPFAPSEADLAAWLNASADSLRTYAEPDKSLLGTQYLGLLRKDQPVGCEIFTTTLVTRRTRLVYSFNDRAFLHTPDGNSLRLTSTGLSDPSFTGLHASLTLATTGPNPTDLTVSASRAGELVTVQSLDRGRLAPRTLQVNTAGKPVALSGELQRLIRLRKWQPGDILALWDLDMVNGNLSPVVLRALPNPDKQIAGRTLGPVKVETWAQQDADHPALVLQSTTFFDPAGALALVTKPDGIIKLVLTKTDFEKDWEPRFPKPD